MNLRRYPHTKTEASLVSPSRYMSYAREIGWVKEEKIPDAVILCFQSSLLNYVLSSHPSRRGTGFFQKMNFLTETEEKIALFTIRGIGAPAAAVDMDELVAYGVKKFLIVGTAGNLVPDVRLGSLVLCTGAIKDEGISRHYDPQGDFSLPSRTLTERLRSVLKSRGVTFAEGSSWTTDAPYRETLEEVTFYRNQGVRVVEMEAAALFSVAKLRGAEVAAMFSVSDDLSGETWNPAFHSEDVKAGLETLFQAAVHALGKNE